MSHRGKCIAPFTNTGSFRIVDKQAVTPNVKRFEVEARGVASRGKAGQFVIVRIDEKGKGSQSR
jgi:NAD(P)H-flavin reductase